MIYDIQGRGGGGGGLNDRVPKYGNNTIQNGVIETNHCAIFTGRIRNKSNLLMSFFISLLTTYRKWVL